MLKRQQLGGGAVTRADLYYRFQMTAEVHVRQGQRRKGLPGTRKQPQDTQSTTRSTLGRCRAHIANVVRSSLPVLERGGPL